jgi:hypothetical protein
MVYQLRLVGDSLGLYDTAPRTGGLLMWNCGAGFHFFVKPCVQMYTADYDKTQCERRGARHIAVCKVNTSDSHYKIWQTADVYYQLKTLFRDTIPLSYVKLLLIITPKCLNTRLFLPTLDLILFYPQNFLLFNCLVFQLDIVCFLNKFYVLFQTKQKMQNFYNSVKSGGLKVCELLTPVLRESKFQVGYPSGKSNLHSNKKWIKAAREICW